MSARAGAVLIHGKRRIKQGMERSFQDCYQAYAEAVLATPGVKAVFAFGDTKPNTFWHMLWCRDAATFESARAQSAEEAEQLQLAYESTPEDPDILHAYGGWDQEMKRADSSVRFQFHKPLAGYIKQDGAGEQGPPLIGFTRRHVLPGRVEALASSFQAVCDLWYDKVPGILAATVSRDETQLDVVHDVRIFANHAAYTAHVDKSDPALTRAMDAWFANYDTALPFTGELYIPGESSKDDGIRTSSIKDRPVRAGFSEFAYGQATMLGAVPNMTKDD